MNYQLDISSLATKATAISLSRTIWKQANVFRDTYINRQHLNSVRLDIDRRYHEHLTNVNGTIFHFTTDKNETIR